MSEREKKLESCLRQIDGAVDALIPHIEGNAEAEQAVRTIMDTPFSLFFLLDEPIEVE